MTSSNHTSLPSESFAHIDIKYHMAVYKLVSRRSIFFFTLGLFKGDTDVFRFFTNCVPPQSVSVLKIYLNCFCDGLRHLQAKFVCANQIFVFHFRNYPFPFLQYMRNPPRKCSFLLDSCKYSIFTYLNWITLFHVLQWDSSRRAIFPSDEHIPSFGGLSTSPVET